jgi:two-component system response regulator FixJ
MPSETIALIDDDPAVLDSLRMVLANRGFAAACFASAEAFLDHAGGTEAACIVSDVRMPGRSGLELQDELQARALQVPLILITGHGDVAMAVRAIKAGAFDFIEKPFDHDLLIAAIRRAIDSNAQVRTLQDRMAEVAGRVGELSLRQRQVLDLVAQGLSNKEIAVKLGLSPRTVENYRAWVMERMGAKNLAELVRMVVELETRGALGAFNSD